MLFLLFLYYLLQGPSINAGPIPMIEDRSLTGNHYNDLAHCRTVWNIVWSCLVTIFSCTWVAVHPNVPCPKKQEANGWIKRCIWNSLLSFFGHRLPLFICALLVLKYMLAWAIIQFLRAHQIAKSEFKLCVKYLSAAGILSKPLLEWGWSTAHGFFVIMGGFHLFQHGSVETSNNDEAMLHDHNISLHSLATCNPYRDGMYPPNRAVLQSIRADINFTSFMLPTKEEIKDRGKNDWLAKSLVLLQMSWFVMQCITCAIEHLPVTHLEIVMLAYAAMNFMIYIFWWNKPLNVYQPVQVFQKSEPSVMQSRAQGTELTWYRDIDVRGIVMYIAGNQDNNNNLEYKERVPRFWADSDETDVERADKIVLGVGVCFGAIHCIAWGFSFLTHTKLLMWRVLCIAMTAVPIYIPLGFYLAKWSYSMPIASILILPAALLYILARAVTLVLAFTFLRNLPPGAYKTIHWTTFIPPV